MNIGIEQKKIQFCVELFTQIFFLKYLKKLKNDFQKGEILGKSMIQIIL